MTLLEFEKILKQGESIHTEFKSWIKASNMQQQMEYIESNESITNEKIRELCGFTKQQARNTLDKMRQEQLVELLGKGRSSKYIKTSGTRKKLENKKETGESNKCT